MTGYKELSCPICGSKDIKRKTNLVDWKWFLIMIVIGTFLDISVTAVTIFILVGIIGFIADIGFKIANRKKWTWECKSCKKEFTTENLNKKEQ